VDDWYVGSSVDDWCVSSSADDWCVGSSADNWCVSSSGGLSPQVLLNKEHKATTVVILEGI
jgi:uncharacterized protein (DUF2237 family)